MKLRLIKVKNPEDQHVSMADVNDFELTVMESSDFKICYESKYIRKLVRPPVAGLVNKLCPKFEQPALCISMGASGVYRSFPHMFFSKENILYLFDAWPGTYDLIKKIIKTYNIKILFISSRESATRLQLLIPSITVKWCPEGIRNKIYRPYDYQMKDIDVLQMGRKYDVWHDRVVKKLHHSGITYLYERVKGEIVFKTRDEFVSGLGRSKISICFPKSVTHGSQCGGISTMTLRYLESIASKCLILGMIPDEMKELFGYNPGITVDMDDPAGQIVEILGKFSVYIPLIEKNYMACINHHDWSDRWIRMQEVIHKTLALKREG